MKKQAKKPAAQPGWSEKKKNIVTVAVLLAFLAVIGAICGIAIGCSGSNDGAPETTTEATMEKLDPITCGYEESATTTDYVCMTVQYVNSKGQLATGDIVVHLRADAAPITVANFQKLVGDGFYNGLTFHRVVSGFMIQGGDPQGNGTGGSSQTIKGEFSENGVNNPLKHKRGVISMARSNSYNSASSQFFIMHQEASNLDGNYAAFGEVCFGMETVDGIAGTAVTYNSSFEKSQPLNAPKILKAYFVTVPESK